MRCAPAEEEGMCFGPMVHTAPTLSLPVSVRRSLHSVSVEVCARLWLLNESHLPLRCQPSSPTACSLWQRLPPSLGETALPVPLMSPHDVHELFLAVATPDAPPSTPVTLSLAELLQADDQSDELLLHVTAGMSVGGSGRGLHLGAKLLPLSHKMSSSMLLVLSPRFVLINQTSKPVQFALFEADVPPHLLLPSPPGRLVDWAPLHPPPPHPPRMQLRRTERGSEWSGKLPMSLLLAAPAEVTFRLRNLESGESELPRLTSHPLQTRATTALVFREGVEESAPMLLHNATRHPLTFHQSGVPILTTLPPGESCRYAWDELGGREELVISVPSLRLRFRTDASPCRMVRPWLPLGKSWLPVFGEVRPWLLPFREGRSWLPLFGRVRLQLCVDSEGALTRFVLSELPSPSPRATLSPSEWGHGGKGGKRGKGVPEGKAAKADVKRSGSGWGIKLDLPGIGLTLLDNSPRELLHLSLRGVRYTARLRHEEGEVGAGEGGSMGFTMALCIASIQLDSQLPSDSPLQEVLLEGGVNQRVDVLSSTLSLSLHTQLPVIQAASVALGQITLRVDEQLLDAIASVLQREVVHSLPLPSPSPSLQLEGGIAAELGGAVAHASGRRVFVKLLRLHPIQFKLSLRSSRPDVTLPTDESGGVGERGSSTSLLGWLRWLGITLLGLEDAPINLPEVSLRSSVIPLDGLLSELGQRYTRALISEVQKKLLPSAALLGDPYGTLRTLGQGMLKQRS